MITKKYLILLSRGIRLMMLAGFLLTQNVMAHADSPTFSVTPVGNSKDSRVVFEDVLPGQHLAGYINVNLISNVPSKFKIDFRSGQNLGLAKDEALDENLSNLSMESWVEFVEGSDFTMNNAGQYGVPYRVKIPSGVSPGDYSGLFIISIEDYGDAVTKEVTTGGAESVGAGAKIRVGVGLEMIIRVAGEIKPSVLFEDLTYRERVDGGLDLKFDYTNAGNVAVKPVAKIVVFDIWGRRVYTGEQRFQLALPNSLGTGTASIPIEEFNFTPGIFRVETELNYEVYSFVRKAEVILVSAGKAKLMIYRIPSWFYLLMALAFLGTTGYYAYANYRFVQLYRTSRKYIVRKGDNLQGVSEKFDVDPQKIIIVNKLKKPYFLKEKETILIPEKQGKNEKISQEK